MNTENQELKDMTEKYEHHKEQCKKYLVMECATVCVVCGFPPAFLLTLFFYYKVRDHLKIIKALREECLDRSLSETDNAGYAKLYQYMLKDKKWFS